ncbi:hypothetical protein KI688_003849 [Linnemannia hyalina]|uniref:Uncharacterized protein n=1 Tax=Linnemannia hyalina TaxID=64524 RepID=A0A9P7XMQ4_9FUNG|nr:hypothetical protein KI688_003849 [Linnemannia hyalina]
MDNKQDNPLPTLTFQPCGIDDLREEDVAEFLDPLPGIASALREEEKEQGGAGAKEEQETLAAVYRDEPAALKTLRRASLVMLHGLKETSEVCSEASPFLYTETWYCHCAGKPEIKKKAEGKKRRQVFKSSRHMGCLARVYVHKFKDDHPPAPGYPVINSSKRVRLTYYGRHTGHVLGELEGFQHLRISKPLREEILSYIKLGLGIRAIKDKLTLHSDVL